MEVFTQDGYYIPSRVVQSLHQGGSYLVPSTRPPTGVTIPEGMHHASDALTLPSQAASERRRCLVSTDLRHHSNAYATARRPDVKPSLAGLLQILQAAKISSEA
jgi:hypothetical protein